MRDADGARLRQPVKGPYADALGRATFCFAILEWNGAWCCERMQPGTLTKLEAKRATSFDYAKKLVSLAKGLPPSSDSDALVDAAEDFRALVKVRNDMLHAKPCTGPNGDAILSRHGQFLTIEVLERFADQFSECSIRLNAAMHGFLKPA